MQKIFKQLIKDDKMTIKISRAVKSDTWNIKGIRLDMNMFLAIMGTKHWGLKALDTMLKDSAKKWREDVNNFVENIFYFIFFNLGVIGK